ncbi:speckle targeted PIP5K1A-regulated poly(A) polymerase-like [Uloborus diversus]|uniref:speckle targeted PIP5K1A-regulated poly(A) polymerase-like n=1 Tax=Uloborus diversus TaxID=327109 RepID=UPI002408F2BF|nr:speckle targeted PIP5K1A-regulated poly(A) polymerase-like [Uloborus diversus]
MDRTNKKTMPYFVQPNKPAEESSLDTLLPDFPSGMNLSEQMAMFSDLASLTDGDYTERFEIAALIKRRLRFYFPNCEVLLFGSTVNGLGFKGCDLDLLFLSYPQYSNTPDDPEEKVSLKVRLKDINLRLISKETLLKLDETSLLQFIKQELFRVREIRKLIYIPAKHPILNFNAGESSITCDLSASNRLVFYNSALLNFFLKIDRRVKLLAMCLRFWAKKLNFIKKGEFTSYAFTLMIIFFLQNVQPPILPSVKQLSDSSGYSRMVDGWECSFTEDLQGLHSENEETPDVLLLKFFAFYWQLNFTSNVISTYVGKAIPVKDLLNFSDERMKQFEVSPICVQDPFILSKNVTANVNHIAVHSFKQAMVEAYNMLQKAGNELQLTHFFNLKRFEYSKHSSGGSRIIVIHPSLDDFQLFENENQWYSEVAWGVHEVLDFVLLFECEVIDMDSRMPNSSFRKNFTSKDFNLNVTEDSKDFPLMQNDPVMFSEMLSKNIEVELDLLLSIQCSVYLRTWFNRKNISEAFQGETDEVLNGKNVSGTVESEALNPVLRQERSISNAILASSPLLTCSEPMLWFRCDIYKYNKKELSDIVVMLVPLKPAKEITAVFMFLHSFLPKTVIRYLRSMKQSAES